MFNKIFGIAALIIFSSTFAFAGDCIGLCGGHTFKRASRAAVERTYGHFPRKSDEIHLTCKVAGSTLNLGITLFSDTKTTVIGVYRKSTILNEGVKVDPVVSSSGDLVFDVSEYIYENRRTFKIKLKQRFLDNIDSIQGSLLVGNETERLHCDAEVF